MTAKTYNIPLAIAAAYDSGEWRLSKEVIGPRGGRSWKTIYSTAATGGYLTDLRLEPGEYKVTYWVGNWPRSYRFTMTEDGERIDHSYLTYLLDRL